MNKYLLSSFAALAISASTFAADKNDIILGFWTDPGVKNVEVVVADTSALKTSQTLNVLTNINGLLTTAYGADWNTRSDLFFGYAGAVPLGQTGTSNEKNRTLFAASNTTSSLLDGVQTGTAYNRGSVYSQGSTAASIESLFPAFGSNSSVVISTEESNSWSKLGGEDGFAQSFDSNQFINTVNFSSSSYVASDLFEMQPGSGPGTYLGTFALYANGDVAFVNMASAIPEPSTYAAILGAAALGFAALRRRQLASA